MIAARSLPGIPFSQEVVAAGDAAPVLFARIAADLRERISTPLSFVELLPALAITGREQF